jgi:hypothetical protein
MIAYLLGFISYSRRKISLNGRHHPWVVFGNGIDWLIVDMLESGVQAKIFECLVEYSIRLDRVPIVKFILKSNKAFFAKFGWP